MPEKHVDFGVSGNSAQNMTGLYTTTVPPQLDRAEALLIEAGH